MEETALHQYIAHTVLLLYQSELAPVFLAVLVQFHPLTVKPVFETGFDVVADLLDERLQGTGRNAAAEFVQFI